MPRQTDLKTKNDGVSARQADNRNDQRMSPGQMKKAKGMEVKTNDEATNYARNVKAPAAGPTSKQRPPDHELGEDKRGDKTPLAPAGRKKGKRPSGEYHDPKARRASHEGMAHDPKKRAVSITSSSTITLREAWVPYDLAPTWVMFTVILYHLQDSTTWQVYFLYWLFWYDGEQSSGHAYAEESTTTYFMVHMGSEVISAIDTFLNNQPYRLYHLFDALFLGGLFIWYSLIFYWFDMEVKCTCTPANYPDNQVPRGCRNLDGNADSHLMDRCTYLFDDLNWNYPFHAMYFSLILVGLVVPIVLALWTITTIWDLTAKKHDRGEIWYGTCKCYYWKMPQADYELEFGRAWLPFIPLGMWTAIRGFLFVATLVIFVLSLQANVQGVLWLSFFVNWSLLIQTPYMFLAFLATAKIWRDRMIEDGK